MNTAEKVGHRILDALVDQLPGGALLRDHKGWDPIVPHDLHSSKLPPIAADGTGECWRCLQRVPFAELDIANEAYVCRPCAMRANQASASASAAQVNVDTVKIGRGPIWIVPLAFAIAIGVCVAVYFA
jgi:hypothetical protein